MVDFREIVSIGLFGLGALIAGSLLLSSVFGFPVLQGGPALLIMIVVAAILLVWNIATKRDFNFSREDIVALLLVVAIIVAAFIYFPKVVPQIFSVLRDSTASVVGLQ